MTEHNCSMVRVVLLDKYVTIEASHLMYSEYADRTDSTSNYGDKEYIIDLSADDFIYNDDEIFTKKQCDDNDVYSGWFEIR